MHEMTMSDTPTPSRRARRAADAALRADLRRRDRIDRYARAAVTPSPGGVLGRVRAALRHAPA